MRLNFINSSLISYLCSLAFLKLGPSPTHIQIVHSFHIINANTISKYIIYEKLLFHYPVLIPTAGWGNKKQLVTAKNTSYSGRRMWFTANKFWFYLPTHLLSKEKFAFYQPLWVSSCILLPLFKPAGSTISSQFQS